MTNPLERVLERLEGVRPTGGRVGMAAHGSGLSLSEYVPRAVDDAALRDEHRENRRELRRTE